MKKLLSAAIVLALAIVLILTKPVPREIASAFTGEMNYLVINREKMPANFTVAAAAATIMQSVQEVFDLDMRGRDAAVQWRTRDFILLTYSDLTLARVGSLKCAWLLRSGFCFYVSR